MTKWGRARRKVYLLGTAVLLAVTGVPGATPGVARAQESNAVVLVYHRFGEDRLPTTSIRTDQFDAHIAELTSGAYNVLPLEEVANALRDGAPLPDRTVAITVDDAFLSVYTEAWPRLRESGLPFTLFVSTDPVDEGRPAYMTWDQLRELVAAGVSIGNHTASHLHMADASPAQSAAAIARSRERFRAELGMDPVLFAYPYGEASLEVRKIVVRVRSRLRATFGRRRHGTRSPVPAALLVQREFQRDRSFSSHRQRASAAGPQSDSRRHDARR